MADNRFAQEVGSNELADADTGRSGVVGDDREIVFLLPDEFVDQHFRRPDAHEAADHQRRPVRDQSRRLIKRDRFHFWAPAARMPRARQHIDCRLAQKRVIC
jgi:hypothetical protein